MSDDLTQYRSVHIVGVGGAGMSGIAKLLAQQGKVVTGSDLKPGRMLDMLDDLGVETWIGHRPERVPGVDLVVASSAVPDRDPELRAAAEAGIPVWRRPRLLGAMTAERPAVGFTGTHGKTTSTALAVTGLRAAGGDPTFLVGGALVDANTGSHLGTTDPFVIEADEAFGTFRSLHLEGLMVTNIEADHLDYYETVAGLEEAFALVAGRVRGPVVGGIDDPGVRRLAQRVPLVGYGFSADAEWRIHDLTHDRGSVAFTLAHGDRSWPVTVPRPGRHIAANAAGVIALLAELGHDPAPVAAGLASFAGVRRRFEVKANLADVTVVDDYAHHPTEIAATVAAGREGGWERVWAVFQPHRYTRTADLGPQFGAPLAAADQVVVTDVYAAGEQPIPGIDGRLVADAVAAAGGVVRHVPAVRDVPAAIADELRPGDLVLLLGAGDVNSIAEEIAGRLAGRVS